jgi:ketosteroid isomerase-like protein
MNVAELEALEANVAFYRAFAAKDLEAMVHLWAERHPVACVHPGWDVLEGRDRVLASWRDLFHSGNSPEITCSHAAARVLGDVAVVTCHEMLSSGLLATTNVFVREDGRWRMAHHHAAPIAPGQVRSARPAGPVN